MSTPRPSPAPDLHFEVAGPDDPEALARLVLRCRQLTGWLQEIGRLLPRREDAPFLYEQLEGAGVDLGIALADLGNPQLPEAEDPDLDGERAYGLQGTAWTIPVTEMLDFLSHASKTGILYVTTFQETFLLELTDGHLVHATSDSPPDDMRLGEILVAQNVLGRSELEEHVREASEADELLGSYLVDRGFVEHPALQAAMAVQVQALFNRLSKADNAIYRFREGEAREHPQGLQVNIKRLLLESARLQDEQSAEADLFGLGEELLPILPFDPIGQVADTEPDGPSLEDASDEAGDPADEEDALEDEAA